MAYEISAGVLGKYVPNPPKEENLNSTDCYLYLYHLDQFVVLPTMPEEYGDTMQVSFTTTPVLMRTAPIISYAHSGPRVVNISLDLRRDMFDIINTNVSNLVVDIDKDYVDTIISQLQASVLPRYAVANKMVDPPMVAVRFGSDLFIKGVIQSDITVTHKLPLLEGNKYANINIRFSITEVDPYDAVTVANSGALRGLSRTLERSLYK